MANKKVLELTSYSSVLSTDYIVIDRPAGTANTQLSAVAAYVLSLPLTASILADNSVTNVKMTDNSISTDEISARSVTTGKIALSAVTSAELADNSVSTDKISARCVTTSKIGLSAVTSAELADRCITSVKLSDSIVNPYGGLKVDSVSGLSVETKIHPDITTSSTLGLSASNRIVGVNSATAITIIVPADSTTNFDIGTNIVIYQKGLGQVTLSGAVGITLLSNLNKVKLTGQYSSAALFKVSANSWLLGGDLTV
jgi:hypothetical protein